MADQMETSKNLSGPDGMPEDPPPYQGSSPAPPPPAATVTTIIPGAVVIQQSMGPRPAQVTCQSCHNEVVTRVEWKVTTRTHIFAGLLCLFGCWPCFWIPYVLESTRNAEHSCPRCNAFIGSYVR